MCYFGHNKLVTHTHIHTYIYIFIYTYTSYIDRLSYSMLQTWLLSIDILSILTLISNKTIFFLCWRGSRSIWFCCWSMRITCACKLRPMFIRHPKFHMFTHNFIIVGRFPNKIQKIIREKYGRNQLNEI